jgi:hypothetical protein
VAEKEGTAMTDRTELAKRLRKYLELSDCSPGEHSDSVGANAWELMEEAAAALSAEGGAGEGPWSLSRFFREEEPSFGFEADTESMSPEQAAITLMRRLRRRLADAKSPIPSPQAPGEEGLRTDVAKALYDYEFSQNMAYLSPWHDLGAESLRPWLARADLALAAMRRLAPARVTPDQRLRPLIKALWQLLDDMGADGLCVCQAAKDQAIEAMKPFVDFEETGEISPEPAQVSVTEEMVERAWDTYNAEENRGIRGLPRGMRAALQAALSAPPARKTGEVG